MNITAQYNTQKSPTFQEMCTTELVNSEHTSLNSDFFP